MLANATEGFHKCSAKSIGQIIPFATCISWLQFNLFSSVVPCFLVKLIVVGVPMLTTWVVITVLF